MGYFGKRAEEKKEVKKEESDEETQKKLRLAEEEAKTKREELRRRYVKFILNSIFDENKANSEYAEASRMAEALGLPNQAAELAKIAEDEARHSTTLQFIAQDFQRGSRRTG